MDYGSMLNSAYMRFAGDTPLPDGLDALRNLILKGSLRDETGSITITPQGMFEISPSNSPLSVRGSAGGDPSIQLLYQSPMKPGAMTEPSAAVDEALRSYMQTY